MAERLLERRRLIFDVVSKRLAEFDDCELSALLSRSAQPRPSVHGSTTGIIDLEGTKVFVKQVALTDLERAAGPSTANVFELPGFYHYGVGSAGFGAHRELQASLQATGWALSGEMPYFPLTYHWRILPRNTPALSAEQRAWLDRAPEYWENNTAVRARLAAIDEASASIVLFVEYVPQGLGAWLTEQTTGGVSGAAEESIARIQRQWREAAAFMNDRGMLHFDMNASNILVDGDQIYVADFGLAISEGFDLGPEERAFFEDHRLYDASYVIWAFAEWLSPRGSRLPLTKELSKLVEPGCAVASAFGAFIKALATESKRTPFPKAVLESLSVGEAEKEGF